MWRSCCVALAAGIIASSAYVHGLWTNRWALSRELERAVALVDRFPMTLGDWQARPERLSEQELAYAGIDGYFLRRYEDRRSGKSVTVLLACGRPGPLSVHTPDICYQGLGYEPAEPLAQAVHKYGPEARQAEFRSARFRQNGDAAGARLRVLWAWRARGGWAAPASPRRAFVGEPALYKLYVLQQLSPARERADEEVCKEFLGKLLPELDRVLSGKS